MTDPSIDKFLIQVLGFFNAFVASFIVLIGKEFFSTLSGSHQMDYSLISSVTKLHSTPTSLVKNCLPHIFIGVS